MKTLSKLNLSDLQGEFITELYNEYGSHKAVVDALISAYKLAFPKTKIGDSSSSKDSKRNEVFSPKKRVQMLVDLLIKYNYSQKKSKGENYFFIDGNRLFLRECRANIDRDIKPIFETMREQIDKCHEKLEITKGHNLNDKFKNTFVYDNGKTKVKLLSFIHELIKENDLIQQFNRSDIAQ